METKLTLKLDQLVIDEVKKYAKVNHQSVSKLVENYFRVLVAQKSVQKKISPLVQELSGVISESDLNGTDYASYLEAKYE
mgnify:CR=1 FL=1